MYEILYRFLVKYKRLDLPGIGIIALQTQPAKSEFVNRSYSPPKYFFRFERGEKIPSEKLFSWLASHFNITESEAVIRFNDFIFDLNRQLKEGKEISWYNVGSFQKENTGEIQFQAVKKELSRLDSVAAKKVTRENAEHTMLVGESERTSTQMADILADSSSAKNNYWWIGPLGLLITILIFLGWYFSEHGITSTSTGNNNKISVKEAPAGYRLTP
jgi:hypothetical protein